MPISRDFWLMFDEIVYESRFNCTIAQLINGSLYLPDKLSCECHNVVNVSHRNCAMPLLNYLNFRQTIQFTKSRQKYFVCTVGLFFMCAPVLVLYFVLVVSYAKQVHFE